MAVFVTRPRVVTTPGIADAVCHVHKPRLAPQMRREIVLALLLLLCYGFFRQAPLWNENTRYDLVRAIVDDHSTRIDSYQGNTGDKALIRIITTQISHLDRRSSWSQPMF